MGVTEHLPADRDPLRCAAGALYVGETHDFEARLAKHNEGTASAFTACRRPVEIVYSEQHDDWASAQTRERQIKRWTRAKKEALIAGDLTLLKRL